MWRALTNQPSGDGEQFWALRPATFGIKRGEVLGLVGHNGAGKSTLLQIISGTLHASVGTLKVNGRLTALLELGAGFNPEFTGRENIELNGPLSGLSYADIQSRMDAIIDFSGIREFIDQPVKTYSSGMFVRLAFALATSVDPEILVVDEALSVGDAEFARKSFDRIMAMRDRGTTILFCSHSAYQIESMCTRALWLDHGVVRLMGEPAAVVLAYQAHLDRMAGGHVAPVPLGAEPAPVVSPSSQGLDSPADPVPAPAAAVITVAGHGRIRRLVASADGAAGNPLTLQSAASTLEVRLDFESDPAMAAPSAAVTINSPDGRILASSGTWIDGVTLQRDQHGGGIATIRFEKLPLLKGRYALSAYLFCERGLHIYSAAEQFAMLDVHQTHLEQGIVSLPHQWQSAPLAPVAEAANPLPPQPQGPATGAPVWQARPALKTDLMPTLALFQRAFAQPMQAERWHWKYQGVDTTGIIVQRGERLVAFFGGMPRYFQRQGQAVLGVQIGDVMVDPDQRGILTRRGPLFLAASTYFEQMGSLYPAVQFAFGFPSARHLKLGCKLGLYAEFDRIHQLAWPALQARARLSHKTRVINTWPDARRRQAMSSLWHAMSASWPDMLLPTRDADRLSYRYLSHPEFSYQLILVSARISGQPQALAVTRAHPDHLEWLDYIGPSTGIPLATTAVRRQAAALGLPEVRGWFSRHLLPLFNHQEPRSEPTDIAIPTNLWGRPSAPEVLQHPLWLMAGDTDFR
jgi:ABC-type polysaccharide/polyol phosphate transport system ATPase subunit